MKRLKRVRWRVSLLCRLRYELYFILYILYINKSITYVSCISAQGKLKNQSSDDFTHPDLIPQKERNIPPPTCAQEISQNPTEAQWFEKVKVTNGGAAGKGPDPPEPPAMSVDGSSEYPNMAEELDAGETEGKTKMAFAKMQIPPNVKDSHLLSDTDFMLNAEREGDENTNEGGGGSSVSGGDSVDSNDEIEAKEALAAQMNAEANTSHSGTRGNTPGGGGLRSSQLNKARNSRANSFRSMANSRQNSGRLLSGNNSETESPRLTKNGAFPESSSSPDYMSSTMPSTGKRDSKAKRGFGVTAHAGSMHGGPSTAGTQLKPIHPPKEPTMAEQAARLGLFT